jgi:hypothetical protein
VKAISIRQPWAGLVAIGAKRYETRSWQTRYRGPIAIHASKHIGPREREFCGHPLVLQAYRRPGPIDPPRQLPRGAVIATARLVAVHRTESIRGLLTDAERCFGDYGDGRFAWELDDVVELAQPAPANGALGIWEFRAIRGISP